MCQKNEYLYAKVNLPWNLDQIAIFATVAVAGTAIYACIFVYYAIN